MIKRILDITVALIGLIILAPILVAIAILIKLDSPGPVFFKGKRTGQHGKTFYILKFRSMVPDAPQKGPAITSKEDPRITRIGRVLRKTKLDELSSLVNVLKGEMSLVGPRPEDPRYVALYTPVQQQVLAVRPGITSPASLHYRDEETLLSGDDWEATYRERILPYKLALDLAYLQQRTVWTDLTLILKTIAKVIRGREYLDECDPEIA
jgi:lipopolysaccharide/colanic/teichoic acid biosynthesis glycosyltransferase